MKHTQQEWDDQLERLPGLMNIARVSLLLGTEPLWAAVIGVAVAA